MSAGPRVALFCETFQEINGVALTARQLAAFAGRHELPFLAIHGAPRRERHQQGSVTRLGWPRGWSSFGIERDLRYDFFFWRYLREARSVLKEFRPDVIHITSPGEFGQLGAYLAHALGLPLVASWHTNFHQFLARRLQTLLSFAPVAIAAPITTWVEQNALRGLLRFYRIARVTLAPTPAQVRWLEESLGRPSFLMPRGVDSEEFHPRNRTLHDETLRIGFVGRVTPEKGVRLLVEIERALLDAGQTNFSLLVVGDGSERDWLQRHLTRGVFLGVLQGEELARAYANMDLFVFPSRTDTFGNVIQEAAASGVPSVVTSEGGPRNLVIQGITGCIAESDEQFVKKVVELAAQRDHLRQMGCAARDNVAGVSWDAAFQMTYAAYRYCQQRPRTARSPLKKAAFVRP
jgi:glycosyltransferase involved in cell wall biosynthesis